MLFMETQMYDDHESEEDASDEEEQIGRAHV